VDPPSVSGHQLSFPSESHLFLFLFYRQCSGRHVVVVVVIFNLLAQQKKMMQFLNWNFEFFFFLVFRVDWVNYYICREAGGRVIDDWAKVSCPSIGSWPAKQAGHGKKYFSIFSRFFI
jgi:hypothetical protein